jgi:glycosyltransferase involved in cell wall biosynthesis
MLDRGWFDLRVVAAAESPLIAKVREAGVPVEVRPAWRFTGGVRNLWAVPGIARWLRRHRVRLVHLNNELYSHLPLIAAARLAGCRILCHLHGWRPLVRSERWAARLVDRFVSVTPSGARYYQAQLGGRSVLAIPNGLMLNGDKPNAWVFGASARRELGFHEDDVLVTAIGRLIPLKGYPVLLRALAIAARTCPRLHGLIVGHDPSRGGRSRTELEQLAETLGIAGRVRFLAWQDDLGAVYAASDIVVQASVEPESFGLVVLEAMAEGKPVVATRLGGVMDLVRDGETGLLVEPSDSEALARGLCRLADDPRLAGRFGREARRVARSEFTMARNAEAVSRVYEELLSVNGGARRT